MSSPSKLTLTNLKASIFSSFLLDVSFLALSYALLSFRFLSLAINSNSTSLFSC
jgi:hypothetical protein